MPRRPGGSLDQVRQRWEGALYKLFQKDPRGPGTRWNNRLATLLLHIRGGGADRGLPRVRRPGRGDCPRTRGRSGLGNWDRAISHFNRALKQPPGDLRLTLERGRCHAQLGRHEQEAADSAEIIGMNLRVLEARHVVKGEGNRNRLDRALNR